MKTLRSGTERGVLGYNKKKYSTEIETECPLAMDISKDVSFPASHSLEKRLAFQLQNALKI